MEVFTTEQIRKYIECPEFGNTHYGKWGALSIEQRRIIKAMCDRIDYQDHLIKEFLKANGGE